VRENFLCAVLAVGTLSSAAFAGDAAVATEAAPAAPSVASSPALVRLLDRLAEVASEGASLEFFGHTEEFSLDFDPADCRQVSGAEVVQSFRELVGQILAGEQVAGQRQAFADFAAIVGEGRYSECRWGYSANRSYSSFIAFVGLDSGYRIQLELGYED
jgi:hypothetical protein